MVSKTSLRCVEQLAPCDSQDPDRNVRFEYEILPLEKRAAIQQLTTEIKEELQKTAHIIWEIGKKLVEVRSQIETCGFNSWLKTEFNWSRRTAYKLISVYEAFPEFSRAQYAQLDISASALYLLAVPSTRPQIRSHFLELALAGERISHQAVRKFIDEFREAQSGEDRLTTTHHILATDRCKDAVQIDSQPSMLQAPHLDLAVVADLQNSDLAVVELVSTDDEKPASSDLRPGWNSIEAEFSLFWGDTNSPRFIERLPEDAFVLAVPSCKWHHDWLLNESRSCINITRSKLDKELVTKLLSVLALSKKAIIFPWLPSWKIIEIALDLNMKVYAGDLELDRCQKIFSRLGLEQQRLDRDLQ